MSYGIHDKVKIGDLVEILRVSIGVPKGTLGVITGSNYNEEMDYILWDVMVCAGCHDGILGKRRRYFAMDLDVRQPA